MRRGRNVDDKDGRKMDVFFRFSFGEEEELEEEEEEECFSDNDWSQEDPLEASKFVSDESRESIKKPWKRRKKNGNA